MKRTPLKSISKKRSKESKTYAQLKREFFEAKRIEQEEAGLRPPKNAPWCEVALKEGAIPIVATDVHHVERRGSNLNNTETWQAVSRLWHDRIEWGANEPLPVSCPYKEEYILWQKETHPFKEPTLTYGPMWARFRGYLK